jgi:hypothetical protein
MANPKNHQIFLLGPSLRNLGYPNLKPKWLTSAIVASETLTETSKDLKIFQTHIVWGVDLCVGLTWEPPGQTHVQICFGNTAFQSGGSCRDEFPRR